MKFFDEKTEVLVFFMVKITKKSSVLQILNCARAVKTKIIKTRKCLFRNLDRDGNLTIVASYLIKQHGLFFKKDFMFCTQRLRKGGRFQCKLEDLNC